MIHSPTGRAYGPVMMAGLPWPKSKMSIARSRKSDLIGNLPMWPGKGLPIRTDSGKPFNLADNEKGFVIVIPDAPWLQVGEYPGIGFTDL